MERWSPVSRPADMADLRRNKRWAGLRPGDPVQVDGTRLRGASWEFVAHITNGETGEVWVEVVGGRAGDRAVRSVPAGPALRADGPAGPRPLPGRRARAPAGLTGGSHGPSRHPDADHAAARPAPVRPSMTSTSWRRIHAEESFWWYPLRSGMSKEETAGFLERVIGALRERRLRHRGAARPGQRGHDRVGGARRAAFPARDPSGGRGGVAPGRRLAWPRSGHRGRCGRGGVRLHRGRPRAHRQHLRAGERGVGQSHGAPGVHALCFTTTGTSAARRSS